MRGAQRTIREAPAQDGGLDPMLFRDPRPVGPVTEATPTSPPAFGCESWSASIGGRRPPIPEVQRVLRAIYDEQHPRFDGDVAPEPTSFGANELKAEARRLGADIVGVSVAGRRSPARRRSLIDLCDRSNTSASSTGPRVPARARNLHFGASSPNQYEAVTPPSIRKSLPVMNAPSAPMRRAATCATSSGVPARPMGHCSIMRR